MCNDLQIENSQEVVNECGQQGQGLAVEADVPKSCQVIAMFAEVAEKFSRFDFLGSNAGVDLDNPAVGVC